MEENRIQNQIAIYMTNKKLCEFTDKLKPAPVEYYAHMHAQGEELPDGFRAYSCIGVVLQDYSKGKGDKTIRVTANLSPGFFPFALSRMQNDLDKFDFHEEKIFGDPDEHGLSTVTKLSIKRATIGTDGKPRNYPWCIILENGRAVKEQMASAPTRASVWCSRPIPRAKAIRPFASPPTCLPVFSPSHSAGCRMTWISSTSTKRKSLGIRTNMASAR